LGLRKKRGVGNNGPGRLGEYDAQGIKRRSLVNRKKASGGGWDGRTNNKGRKRSYNLLREKCLKLKGRKEEAKKRARHLKV